MLVEDTEDDYIITSNFLKKMNFADVELNWCKSSEEALLACQEDDYDIYIFDYHIDQLNGIELAEKIRDMTEAEGSELHKPTIILTNVEDQAVTIEAMRIGADDFVAKNHLSSACLERALSNALTKYRLKEKLAKKSSKLKEINAKLAITNIQVIEMNQQLSKRNDEIGKFYQTVSHEIKTPLTSIREFISIILDGIAGPINEEQAEYLAIALSGCNQMVVYINDLLDVTRLDHQKLSLDKQEQSINSVLKQAIALMQPKANEKKLDVTVEYGDDLPAIAIDADRIKQVLMNVISNAIKFSDSGKTLSISSKYHKQSIHIEISDTGKGIQKEDIPHIFERLYQVEDGDRMSQHGLGLGLYICKEIIKLHDGDITVQSKYGEGTTFTISLPISTIRSEDKKVA